MVDGWVSDVQLYRSTAKITGKIVCVVTGNVKHFQKLSVAPSHPWVAVEPNGNVAQDKNKTDDSWCSCRGAESGEMIMCDNSTCDIQWFRVDCLELKAVPKGKWYCPNYSTKRKQRKRSLKKL